VRRRSALRSAPCQLEVLEDRCLLSAIGFAQPVYRIAEGTRTLDVTLTRDNASDADSVLVVATGGTATGGKVDYWDGAFPVNAIFQPGEREVTVTLVVGSPRGDQVLEGVETIELGLLDNDHHDVMFGAQSTATIEIHDAALSIEQPSRYIHEDGGPYTFTVVLNMAEGFALSEDAVFEVSVNHGVAWPAVVFPDGIARGAVSPNDYALNTTTIRFAAGSENGATQTITLTPVRDNVREGIEGFFFELEQVSGTPFTEHIRGRGGLIIDVPEESILGFDGKPVSPPPEETPPPAPNPPPPPPPDFQPPLKTIEFRDPVYRIAEGTRTVEVTLVRDRTGGADSVLVVATGGTATGGTDYWPGAFPVNAIFEPGQLEATVTLVLMSPDANHALEGVETIELGLVDNDHYDVTFGEQNTATIEIHDAYLSIDQDAYIQEDGRPRAIEVTLNLADGVTLEEDAVFTISVKSEMSGIIYWLYPDDGIRRSVASPDDYWLTTPYVRFAAGSSNGDTQTFRFTPLADDRPEGIESFRFQFEQVAGPPFARSRLPILSIIDVPEEAIGRRPFVVSPVEGRRDNDAAGGGVRAPAESASGGTASFGGSALVVQPTIVADPGIAFVITAETPVSASVPGLQTSEPLPLGRMDLLAEFLSGSESPSDVDEPGANSQGATGPLSLASASDAFESEGLDSAFADDELLSSLSLLAPSL
jgi:hypothetical protein